ncbi:hypothetical protein CXF68_08890 [Tenacibaculum sp. Bg11-29]|uniref:hypothetical protein n=1 Tax=Tenacibaculum sp. Bg11-29 TaxID=2058306 RepID=UPI000C33B68A|nr:hypothetical protein [Tenacibaculum sp. Bg11-29]PKH50795.1 hypothetical protein CXF68_08890 [Tenacibaculum sp. Bg11-29]
MKKFFIIVKQALGILLITLILFEGCYRLYILDFYNTELKELNKGKLNTEKVDFLVFGDSFTTSNTYIEYLEEKTNNKLINSASSGIGIQEVNLFASMRVKEFKPKKIIYQVYLGNDLLDVKNLSNIKKLSLSRSFYWYLSDYFISLLYINKRLSFGSNEFRRSYIFDEKYAKNKYSNRSKLYFLADSLYLHNTVMLKGDFLNRYNIWMKEIEEFIEKSNNIPVYIILVPHCAQLNNKYKKRMQEIGGEFPETAKFTTIEYPFYEETVKKLRKYKSVTILNPLAYFKKKDKKEPLYYANDPHLNNYGQQVLGEYLEQKIIK